MERMQLEVEMAVLESAFATALERVAGLRLHGSHEVRGRSWPRDTVVWTTLTLERPFAGQCWILATPELADLLVERRWRGSAIDAGGPAPLFAEFVAALLNDCVGDVQHDVTACMVSGHCGLGAAPEPAGPRHAAVWVVAGQPLFVALEDPEAADCPGAWAFPAWSEASPSA